MADRRPQFDNSSGDLAGSYKYFTLDFHNYCVLEDYVDPSKVDETSDEHWPANKRPKAIAALHRAFPRSEWATIASKVVPSLSEADKKLPAKWLQALDKHYLGVEPILKCSYNFLRVITQPSGMSVSDWETFVMSEFSKCKYPPEAANRLQRDIFLFGLNESLKSFRSDIVARENMETLTFVSTVAKARAFEDGLRTESAVAERQTSESVNVLSPASTYKKNASRKYHGGATGTSRNCQWCGGNPHSRQECPAASTTCHNCRGRGHYAKVCRKTSTENRRPNDNNNTYRAAARAVDNAEDSYVVHEVYTCIASPPATKLVAAVNVRANVGICFSSISFQVDTGATVNTIHKSDLANIKDAVIKPSNVKLRVYNRELVPVCGEVFLQYRYRGREGQIAVQVIDDPVYYPPLLGFRDSCRLGAIKVVTDAEACRVAQDGTPPPALPDLPVLVAVQRSDTIDASLGTENKRTEPPPVETDGTNEREPAGEEKDLTSIGGETNVGSSGEDNRTRADTMDDTRTITDWGSLSSGEEGYHFRLKPTEKSNVTVHFECTSSEHDIPRFHPQMELPGICTKKRKLIVVNSGNKTIKLVEVQLYVNDRCMKDTAVPIGRQMTTSNLLPGKSQDFSEQLLAVFSSRILPCGPSCLFAVWNASNETGNATAPLYTSCDENGADLNLDLRMSYNPGENLRPHYQLKPRAPIMQQLMSQGVKAISAVITNKGRTDLVRRSRDVPYAIGVWLRSEKSMIDTWSKKDEDGEDKMGIWDKDSMMGTVTRSVEEKDGGGGGDGEKHDADKHGEAGDFFGNFQNIMDRMSTTIATKLFGSGSESENINKHPEEGKDGKTVEPIGDHVGREGEPTGDHVGREGKTTDETRTRDPNYDQTADQTHDLTNEKTNEKEESQVGSAMGASTSLPEAGGIFPNGRERRQIESSKDTTEPNEDDRTEWNERSADDPVDTVSGRMGSSTGDGEPGHLTYRLGDFLLVDVPADPGQVFSAEGANSWIQTFTGDGAGTEEGGLGVTPPGICGPAHLVFAVDPTFDVQDTNRTNNVWSLMVYVQCETDDTVPPKCSILPDPRSQGHVAVFQMMQAGKMSFLKYTTDGYADYLEPLSDDTPGDPILFGRVSYLRQRLAEQVRKIPGLCGVARRSRLKWADHFIKRMVDKMKPLEHEESLGAERKKRHSEQEWVEHSPYSSPYSSSYYTNQYSLDSCKTFDPKLYAHMEDPMTKAVLELLNGSLENMEAALKSPELLYKNHSDGGCHMFEGNSQISIMRPLYQMFMQLSMYQCCMAEGMLYNSRYDSHMNPYPIHLTGDQSSSAEASKPFQEDPNLKLPTSFSPTMDISEEDMQYAHRMMQQLETLIRDESETLMVFMQRMTADQLLALWSLSSDEMKNDIMQHLTGEQMLSLGFLMDPTRTGDDTSQARFASGSEPSFPEKSSPPGWGHSTAESEDCGNDLLLDIISRGGYLLMSQDLMSDVINRNGSLGYRILKDIFQPPMMDLDVKEHIMEEGRQCSPSKETLMHDEVFPIFWKMNGSRIMRGVTHPLWSGKDICWKPVAVCDCEHDCEKAAGEYGSSNMMHPYYDERK